MIRCFDFNRRLTNVCIWTFNRSSNSSSYVTCMHWLKLFLFHSRLSFRYLGFPIEMDICKCRTAKWLVYEAHNWHIAWFCLFIGFDGIDNNFGRFINKGNRPWGLDAAIQSNVKCYSKSISLTSFSLSLSLLNDIDASIHTHTQTHDKRFSFYSTVSDLQSKRLHSGDIVSF